MHPRLGKYHLLGLLGRGGSGSVVYLARKGRFGSPVALKVPGPIAQHADAQVFLREIALHSQLDHPRVIKVLESGLADGLIYFALEYAPGGTLHDLLDGGVRLTTGQVVTVVTQIAEALEYGHNAVLQHQGTPLHGILHRDIKPQNIYLDGKGGVKLGDFGIAKPFESGYTVTTGGFPGTPPYMSPEQFISADSQGRKVRLTPASDVWQLAVVAYELLIGSRPFGPFTAEDDTIRVVNRILDRPPRPPREILPSLDEQVERLLMEALDKDPSRRPGVMEFAQRLREVSAADPEELPASAPAQAVRVRELTDTVLGSTGAQVLGRHATGRVLKLILTLAAVFVVLLAVAGILWWTNRGDGGGAGGGGGGSGGGGLGGGGAKVQPHVDSEKEAAAVLAEAKKAFAAEDYEKALQLAGRGIAEFSGTRSGEEFRKLRGEAEARRAALSATEEGRKLLEEGRAEGDREKCREAVKCFEKARALHAGAELDALIASASEAANAMRDRMAVVNLAVTGDMQEPRAGEIFPRRLLLQFADRFDLVDESQLKDRLTRHNLQASDLAGEKAIENAKLIRVDYLVIGELIRGSDFRATARLVDVAARTIRNPREISASTWAELESRIPVLARLVMMTDLEYRKWQDETVSRPRFMAEAQTAVDTGRWQDALNAYRAAAAIAASQDATDGMALATRKILEEQEKAARYRAAIKAAQDALAKGDYDGAAGEAESALALRPNDPDARAVLAKTLPTLTVTAKVNGAEYPGAEIRIDGILQQGKTPLTLLLEKEKVYKVEVSVPAQPGKFYEKVTETFRADRNGPRALDAVIKELAVKIPPGFIPNAGTPMEHIADADWPKEIVHEKTGMVLVLIPAYKGFMGSPAGDKRRDPDEEPQHAVRITKPFYMGKCEVTRRQFSAFASACGYKTDAEREGGATIYLVFKTYFWFGVPTWAGRVWTKEANTSWRNTKFDQTDDHPVVCVSWNDANACCKWLSDTSGGTVRLPTEAEWEYACRAGHETPYYWGEDADAGLRNCNGADMTDKDQLPPGLSVFNWRDGYVFTAPVASFEPNAWGLCDMLGNVREWCSDWYDATYYAKQEGENPQGPATGVSRVVRGGSWSDDQKGCRSAKRLGIPPKDAYSNLGFRVVVEVK